MKKRLFFAMFTLFVVLPYSCSLFAAAIEVPPEEPASAQESSTPSAQMRERLTETQNETGDPGEIPAFHVELVEDGDASGRIPGLYGTLSFVPEYTQSINAEYSFGGEQYFFSQSGLEGWNLDDVAEDGSLTQRFLSGEEHPFSAWREGKVNSLYIRLHIGRYLENEDVPEVLSEAYVFSHNNPSEAPGTPPPFTASIRFDSGYYIEGRFTDFPPDVARVRTMYSLDGEAYLPVGEPDPYDWALNKLGFEDTRELTNQYCVSSFQEPLYSYRKNKLDEFFLKLEITTDSGLRYDTEPVKISREGPRPLPKHTMASAALAYTMKPMDEWGVPLQDVLYGQYQVTVLESITQEELGAMLPDTLPVEVKIRKEDTGEFLTSGIVECEANWNPLPSLSGLTAGESQTIENAVGGLKVPKGTEVVTPLGTYILPCSISLGGAGTSGEVRLLLDAISADEAPEAVLRLNSSTPLYAVEHDALSVAFWKKPSGARSIKAFFADEGGDKTFVCDLLSQRAVDHNQSVQIYGYASLLRPGDPLLEPYLNGWQTGCSISLEIEGGTFDGMAVSLDQPILPDEWGIYTEVMPEEIWEPEDSSEGQENDAGADNEEDGTEEGQRPNLPKDPDEESDLPSSPPPANGGQTPVEWESSETPAVIPEQPPAVTETSQSPTEPSGDVPPTASGSEAAPPPCEEVPIIGSQDREPAPPEQAASEPSSEAAKPVYMAEADGKEPPARETGADSFIPVAATAAAVLVGGAAAVAVGAGGAAGKAFGKACRALRKFLFPK